MGTTQIIDLIQLYQSRWKVGDIEVIGAMWMQIHELNLITCDSVQIIVQ